jgi:transposase InsO family protein
MALIKAVPYKIHTVLTDNGIQLTLPPRYADGPTARYMTRMFDMRCRENGIEHRLTKIRHPWTNGQVERMNRTVKEASVKRYHYDSHKPIPVLNRSMELSIKDYANSLCRVVRIGLSLSLRKVSVSSKTRPAAAYQP